MIESINSTVHAPVIVPVARLRLDPVYASGSARARTI